MLRMGRGVDTSPQKGCCTATLGNRAGTIVESMVYSQQLRKSWRLRVAIWQPLKINQLDWTLPIPVPAGVTVGYRLGNLLKAKGRGWKGRPRRAYARTLRSVIRKGSALRSAR
jgi:predicted chitinase